MHTITNCPRCGNDFMYHNSDTHLYRPVAWDSDTKEACSFEAICQDCDYVETYGDGVLKYYEIQNYNDYKKVVEEMWQHGDLNELTEAGFIVVDNREYRENGTVSKETMRVLTEKEFYARFVEPTSDQDLLPLEDRGEWERGGATYLTDEELEEELPF